jgi:hypothetical protein
VVQLLFIAGVAVFLFVPSWGLVELISFDDPESRGTRLRWWGLGIASLFGLSAAAVVPAMAADGLAVPALVVWGVLVVAVFVVGCVRAPERPAWVIGQGTALLGWLFLVMFVVDSIPGE